MFEPHCCFVIIFLRENKIVKMKTSITDINIQKYVTKT